jgi:hypothetical protein
MSLNKEFVFGSKSLIQVEFIQPETHNPSLDNEVLFLYQWFPSSRFMRIEHQGTKCLNFQIVISAVDFLAYCHKDFSFIFNGLLKNLDDLLFHSLIEITLGLLYHFELFKNDLCTSFKAGKQCS